MNEIVNATITKTQLGFEDHGTFTCFLMLEGNGWCQGFGGRRLDTGPQDTESNYGIEFLKGILKALEVKSWEDLPGIHVRIERNDNRIYRIGHVVMDRWFCPAKLKYLLAAQKENP